MTTAPASIPTVTVPRYAAPTITVTPVTEVIPSEPVDGRHGPGHYQSVLLNTRTGVLAFHESTEHRERWDPEWRAVTDVPRETWLRWHPGTAFAYRGRGPAGPVPELISWVIDSGHHVPGLPYLDAVAAAELLAELTPYAEELLGGLYEVDGDLDWSALALRAGRQIGRLCSRDREAGGPEVDADLYDYGTIVAVYPQAYQPDLIGVTRERLTERCEIISQMIGSNEHWHPEIRAELGVPTADRTWSELTVVGVRAWYLAARRDGDPRPQVDFAAWDTERARLAAGEITSAMTDRELDAWIDREEQHAGAAPGVRLLGTRDAVYDHRAQLRAQDWDRLAVVGSHVAQLEAELRAARGERLALVTRALAWGLADADIAGQARMTRQAVHKIKTSDTD